VARALPVSQGRVPQLCGKGSRRRRRRVDPVLRRLHAGRSRHRAASPRPWPDETREKSGASGRTGKKEADDWRPIFPVPANAPPPSFEHRRLGRLASAWQYKDATGEVLGYTAQFNKPDGGKDILSYTYCRASDGRREWRWQSFPKPRPLYRWDRLAERQLEWVLVVEGEKTADAATELFPDHVTTTSSGGSKAAGAADWSPLKGRKVAIWPDADETGRKYAEQVARLVRKADAARVVVQVPDSFAEAWDLADPPPPGWDLGGLRRLLDEAAFGKDTPVPDFTTVLDQAAELDSVSYDRRRDELAEKLGIRKSTLDAEVNKRRQERQEEKRPFLVEPPGWEQPVDGATLLDAIVAEVRRYLVMPEHAPEAVALWILHAHAHDAFQCSPILAVVSPEKRCGKTRTLDVIRTLCRKVCSPPTRRLPLSSASSKSTRLHCSLTRWILSSATRTNCAASSIPAINAAAHSSCGSRAMNSNRSCTARGDPRCSR
jgi:5S rRNA maturation endonuclease (ribonuclease M5)